MGAEEVEPAATPRQPQTPLDIFERLAKILAIVAIPVVIPLALAIYSSRVQEAAQTETINRDYVQLAVSLLKEKKNDLDPGIRDWAVDLLAEHSPTKFKPEVIEALKNGTVSLSSRRVISVSVVSKNSKLMAQTNAGGIEVMKIPTGEVIRMIQIPSAVNDIDFSEDDSLLAVGCQDGNTLIYKTANWQLYSTIPMPDPVLKAEFAEDDKDKIEIETIKGKKLFPVAQRK